MSYSLGVGKNIAGPVLDVNVIYLVCIYENMYSRTKEIPFYLLNFLIQVFGESTSQIRKTWQIFSLVKRILRIKS